MAVNKLIIEAHSNPLGLYQIRWQFNGAPDGVNDDQLDMTLSDALQDAYETANLIQAALGIKLKKKNIIVNVQHVKRLAERDPSSKEWLEQNKYS